MKVGLIYKAVCPNKKIYIGQTTQVLTERIRCHQKDSKRLKTQNIKFYHALRKYGPENFKWEIVEDDIPQQFLNIKECEYIQIFDSYKNGYNSTTGGDFQPMNSLEIRQKLSKSLKGKKFSRDHKTNISKSKLGVYVGSKNPMFGKVGFLNPNFGKKLTEEHKRKIANSKIGKKRPDVSLRFKNRVISEEHKKILSDLGKKKIENKNRDAKGRFVKDV